MEIFTLLDENTLSLLDTSRGPIWDIYSFNDGRREVVVKSASANDPEVNVFQFTQDEYDKLKFLLTTYYPNTTAGSNAAHIYEDRERIKEASKRLLELSRKEGETNLRNRELQAEADELVLPEKEASLEEMRKRAKGHSMLDFMNTDPRRIS